MIGDYNFVTKSISKQQDAYEKIKYKIIRNEFHPDSMLVERQLCETLNISRTPIREALHRLSSEGYINFIPDKGMFVSKIRFEDMMEIFEIREALESMAIKLFVQRKDANTVGQIKESLIAQEEAYSQGNYISFRDRNTEFHQLYINGSKNNRLINILKMIMDMNDRMTFFNPPSKARSKDSLIQHRKIFRAIETGNADLAAELIKNHIIDIKKYHINMHETSVVKCFLIMGQYLTPNKLNMEI